MPITTSRTRPRAVPWSVSTSEPMTSPTPPPESPAASNTSARGTNTSADSTITASGPSPTTDDQGRAVLSGPAKQAAPGEGERLHLPAVRAVDDVLDLRDVLAAEGHHRLLDQVAGPQQGTHRRRPFRPPEMITPPPRRLACTATNTPTSTRTTTTTMISHTHQGKLPHPSLQRLCGARRRSGPVLRYSVNPVVTRPRRRHRRASGTVRWRIGGAAPRPPDRRRPGGGPANRRTGEHHMDVDRRAGAW